MRIRSAAKPTPFTSRWAVPLSSWPRWRLVRSSIHSSVWRCSSVRSSARSSGRCRRRIRTVGARSGRRPPRHPGTPRRLPRLVVANRTLQGPELRAELSRRASTGTEFHIVAPIMCSRIHYIASDIDKELDEARDPALHGAHGAQAEGVTVTGKVGDPNAALGAIEDELRQYGADEVIISTYPRGKSNWLETASSSDCATSSRFPSRTWSSRTAYRSPRSRAPAARRSRDGIERPRDQASRLRSNTEPWRSHAGSPASPPIAIRRRSSSERDGRLDEAAAAATR